MANRNELEIQKQYVFGNQAKRINMLFDSHNRPPSFPGRKRSESQTIIVGVMSKKTDQSSSYRTVFRMTQGYVREERVVRVDTLPPHER